MATREELQHHEVPQTRLQKLELEHANEGQLEDIHHSNAISSDQALLGSNYFFSFKVVGALWSIALAVTASYWGFSPPAAILTQINQDIGPSPNSALFSIVWSMTSAVSICVFGRTSDKFGRRWFLIIASCMGFIGGIIAARAQNMNTLIGANVLLGLAGGVHTCYGLLAGEIMPNRYKMVGVVLVVVPAVLPTGFGAYLSLSLVHHANWRWCYYIFLMLMGPAIIFQIIFYHPPSFRQLHGGTRTVMDEVRRVDFIGAFLLVSGLALFLLGISWGGTEGSAWGSARILGLTITGGIVLILFVLYECFTKTPNPLIPMRFFKDIRGFVCLNIIAISAGTMYLSLSILWPSQVGYIYSAKYTNWHTIGWLSTTIAFGVWSGIIIVGSVLHVVKHIRYIGMFLMAMAVAFLGALSTADANNMHRSAAFSYLAGFPAGIMELIPAILVQLDAIDADLGTVFSIIFTLRSAGGSIFAAIFVAILNNKTPKQIAKKVPPAATGAGLPESSLPQLFAAIKAGTPAAMAAVPGMTAEVGAAVSAALSSAYAKSYSYVYYAAIAVGAVGLIAAICLKDYDALLTSHVPRTIGKDTEVTEINRSSETERDMEKTSGSPTSGPEKTHHITTSDEKTTTPTESSA